MSVVERYKVQFLGGPLADVERWVLPGADSDLLMGGSINGVEDWNHLKKDFGVTHVLNLESEHDDSYLGPPEIIGQLPTPDNGQFKNPDWFAQGVAFAQFAAHAGRLYLHCQAGGSRTPAMLYAILRHHPRSHSPRAALDLIRSVKPSFGTAPYHSNYIASAEVALLALKAIDP